MRVHESVSILGATMVLATSGCVVPDVHDTGTTGAGGQASSSSSTTVASSSASASTSGTTVTAGSGTTVTSGSATTAASSSSGGALCPGTATVVMHFSNVAPAAGAVDFCLGTNGNLSGPLAKLAGAPGGLVYGTSMDYSYNVDGPIDIRAVAAGGSCSGASLGDATGVCLTQMKSDQSSASIYYLIKQSLAVLEDEAESASSLRLRFFNAVQGAPSLDFGLTDASTLPTKVSTAVASNVGVGDFPPAGNTILNIPVNAAGYLDITSMPAGVTWAGWGAAVSGSPNAAAVVPFSTVTKNFGVSLTVVAVGDVTNASYPVHFLGFNGSPTKTSNVPTPVSSPSTSLN